MKRILAVLALSLIWGTHAEAQAGKKLWRNLLKVSNYVSVGVNVLDVHSSWGRFEVNPILANSQGQFGTKGVAIKGAVLSGWFIVQRRFNKAGRHDKTYTITNFATSALIGGVVVHNYRSK